MKRMSKREIEELRSRRLDELLTLMANEVSDALGFDDDNDPDGDKLCDIRDALFRVHDRSLFVVDIRKLGEDIDPRCKECDVVMESAELAMTQEIYCCPKCKRSELLPSGAFLGARKE